MDLFGLFKRKKEDLAPAKVSLQQPTNVDFERDMKCLFSTIALAMANEKFKVKISGKTVLSDDDLINLSKSVSQWTLEVLSEEYLGVLSRYIDPDSIPEFVTNIVVRDAVQLGIEFNSRVL